MASLRLHDFYCTCCGQKTFTSPRSSGHLHKRFHKKKLYCLHCKAEINHIECRDEFDVWQFKEDWENGKYINEVPEQSLSTEEKDGKIILDMWDSRFG